MLSAHDYGSFAFSYFEDNRELAGDWLFAFHESFHECADRFAKQFATPSL